MGGLRRMIAVTALSLRTLPQRAGASAVAGGRGWRASCWSSSRCSRSPRAFRRRLPAPVRPTPQSSCGAAATAELSSALGLADTRIIKDAAGVQRARSGPVASAELFVVVDVPKRSTGTVANVPLRGVEPAAFGVREEVRLVEGRVFRPGTNEIIVGRMATTQFAGLDLGSVQRWGESEWEVVGIFEADGTLSESEIWCDARVLQPAYRRGDSFQSVLARLESADVFDRFRTTLTSDPRLDVMVEREDAYYRGQSELIHALITGLGTIIAVLMGIGAVFGAINTMYSAVASRTREIATLRALGFSGFSVVVSVLVESALLSVVGGVLGGVVAYTAFHGYQTATLNWQTFSQVSFAFNVTPDLLVQGGLYALVMGIVGGLFPAVRAARLPIVIALREL